jgi:AAA domain, putative AbiEii toxin, Type IV TA system
MLKSFQIKRFRLFEHIEIERLGRVNLVVGKNNSGKSAFLEAIKLYASNAAPLVLLDLLESRQDDWSSVGPSYSSVYQGNSLRHLFFGRNLPEIDRGGIVLGDISSNDELNINVAIYRNNNDNEGNSMRTRVHSIDTDLDTIYNMSVLDDIFSPELFLIAEENGKTKRIMKLHPRGTFSSLSESYRRKKHEDKYKWQSISTNNTSSSDKYKWLSISTDNTSSSDLPWFWDLTSLTDLRTDVMSALHLIDDRISSLAFVENASQNYDRIPIVKIKGVDEPFPLKSMGDGITRLLQIILTLVNARNGLLLIDEFENGLHWTVQPQVWDVVFQLAEKLNVQVFATTHSRDCVRGFDEAWRKYPDLGAFFRLDNKNGSIKTTEYTAETLTDAIDMDVEVR